MQPIYLVKLTDQQNQTHNNTVWQLNQPHTLPQTTNPKLCSKQVLHAYRSLNLALLLNPAHADIVKPKAFAAETTAVVVEDSTKVGTFDLTITEELPLPKWYVNETLRKKVQLQFAILAAAEVLPIFEAKFPYNVKPRAAIEAAQVVLSDPAAAYAAYAAADAAAAAADDDAYAADAAAADAAAAYAADAAAAAAYAAVDAYYAARAAAYAAAADAYAADAYAADAYARAAAAAAAARAAARAATYADAAYAADAVKAKPTINLNTLAAQAVKLQS